MGVVAGLGGAAIIALAVYGVIDIIVMLFFNGAIYIAEAIMDESIIIFSSGENIITKFVGLIPFSSGIMNIIEGFAYGIMVLAIVVSVLKSITAPVTGEAADNPLNILGRVVFAVVTKYVIFGPANSGMFFSESTGLLGAFGQWFGTVLAEVHPPTDIATNYMSSWGSSPYAYIGYLILAAALIGSVITAAVSYIERIIAFGLSVIVGPVAISMMASRETSNIAKEWIMSIFTQFGAILLNLLLWGAFANKLGTLTTQFGDELTGQLILDIAIAIAILSMIKNCEQIFNSFGLRTIPNADTARSIVGGIAAVGSGATMAVRSLPQVREGLSKLTHGSQPVMGGASGGGHRGGTGIGTGITSLYDKNGKMATGSKFMDAVKNGDIGGIGSAARRGLANSMTAGVIAPQQNRQMAAIGNIGEAVNKAAPGQRYGGFAETGKNGNSVFHTGVEAANMAIGGGKKEGSGIRFQPSASGVMGEALSPGALRGQGHSSEGVYSSKGGNDPSDSLLVGSAVSPTGQEVKGFVGNAAKVNSDGTTTPMGNVFIPTSGANEPLAVGSRIDVGGCEGEGLRIKSAFNVDESGHLGYTTEPIANHAAEDSGTITPITGTSEGNVGTTPAIGVAGGQESYASAPVGAGESYAGGSGDAFAGGGQILGAENMVGADDLDPTAYHQPPDAPVGAYDYGSHPERYDNPGTYGGAVGAAGENEPQTSFVGGAGEAPPGYSGGAVPGYAGGGNEVSFEGGGYAAGAPAQAGGQETPAQVVPASDFYDENLYSQRSAPAPDVPTFAGDGYMPDTNIPESMGGGYAQSAPAYEQPAPMYEQPSGGYEQPTPQYGQSAPTYEQPAPMYEQPSGGYEQSAPLYEQPSGGYDQSAPLYEQPAPMYEQPSGGYEQSAPAYEQSAPMYEQTGGSYESAPMSFEPQGEGGYTAPSASYEPQGGAYESPNVAFEPQGGYEAMAPEINVPQAEAPIIQNQGGVTPSPEPVVQEGSYTENNSFQSHGPTYNENNDSFESASQNFSEYNSEINNSFADAPAGGYDLFAEETPEQPHKRHRKRKHK